MNFATHKIGTRMGFGLGLILLLMISLILLGILSMKNINGKMDAIIKQNNRQIWYANVIKDSIHTIDKAMLTLIQMNDDERAHFEYVRIMTGRATYGNALDRLAELEDSPVGKQLIGKLRTAVTAATAQAARATELRKSGLNRMAAQVYLNDARGSVASLHQICSELVSFEEAQSAARYEEAVQTYNAARKFFIVIAVVMVAFGVTAAIVLTRSITGPIRKGVDIADRLAEGDLSVEIEVKGRDETGQLLSAMKNMVERLKQTKELEHQLLQSQKLETLGRLAGGIAHDFNNMLNVILGSAELIKMQPGLSRKTHDRCVAIEKAVSRASGFVKQLLVFSKRQVLELKPLNMTSIVDDFEKMISRVIGENIEMTIERAAGLPRVRADGAQINQVLLNLVVNAREAMPGGGRLGIELSAATLSQEDCERNSDARPGDYVVLSVSDTGPGMSPEVANSIFEPFFTTKESGTGLGLSVVYGIVKQHGGFIMVHTVEGMGSRFDVFLPSQGAGESEAAEDEHGIAGARGGGTVLVVEDDDEVRNTATELLTLLGYRVHAARDGLEGVEVFRRLHRTIDIVLLDMVMPRMGGYEAYQEMMKINPSIPSLFVTGYNMTDGAPALSGDDGIDAIQKPYSAPGLSRKIKEIMARKAREAA